MRGVGTVGGRAHRPYAVQQQVACPIRRSVSVASGGCATQTLIIFFGLSAVAIEEMEAGDSMQLVQRGKVGQWMNRICGLGG